MKKARKIEVSVFWGEQLSPCFNPLILHKIPKPLNLQLKWQMQLQRFIFDIACFA